MKFPIVTPQSTLKAAANHALEAVRPILAKLPCRSERTIEGRNAFLPTPDEMEEARGALFRLAQVLEITP